MMKAQSQVAVVEKKKTLKRLESNYKRQEFRKTNPFTTMINTSDCTRNAKTSPVST